MTHQNTFCLKQCLLETYFCRGNPASNEFTGTATILGRPPVDIEGSFTKIERKANGTLKWYTYRFAIRKESKFFGKIILNYNIGETRICILTSFHPRVFR